MSSGQGPGVTGAARQARTTGRWIVVFADVETDQAGLLTAVPGVSTVADSRDFDDGRVDVGETAAADATLFHELGMAVVTADPGQVPALGAQRAGQRPVLSVSPELVHHLLPGVGLPDDGLPGAGHPGAGSPGAGRGARGGVDASYVLGYRDGVGDLAGRLEGGGEQAQPPPEPQTDTAEATWGVAATGALTSPRSGRGVRVAVLDTGFDLEHPDFAGRTVTAQSFVPGETAQDGHGHGTHCVGTACGPLTPPSGPRYGVAGEAEVLVGKVLSDAGSGTDAGILAGINWAVVQGCHVVSMSLGADVPQVHPPYTAAGRRALDRGSLLVAAAGNNADRPAGQPGFVGPPASSPHVLAVAALDQRLDVAPFSARSLLATRGGQVDVAAPGVQVLSTWPMPTRYRSISGTSMATPHVAGLAALWAEETGLRGRDLWAVLTMECERLLASSADVGGGLVLAPQ